MRSLGLMESTVTSWSSCWYSGSRSFKDEAFSVSSTCAGCRAPTAERSIVHVEFAKRLKSAMVYKMYSCAPFAALSEPASRLAPARCGQARCWGGVSGPRQ